MTTDRPHEHDVGCLTADLAKLGLPKDRDLLVHTSMKQIGWIRGGARTLASAIFAVTGASCTLVVPTHTTIHSPTSRAVEIAIDKLSDSETERYLQELPGFDPDDLSSEMGLLADHVLRRFDAVRSDHPLVSFAAVGPRAAQLMAGHRLETHLGENSPLGALYAADASILLLGVGYDACSALHLAEYRLKKPKPPHSYTCYVVEAGQRVQKEFTAIHLDDSDFKALGKELEVGIGVPRHTVGDATARLLSMRAAVDFAVDWMNHSRRQS